MYNTNYKCVKPYKIWLHKDNSPRTIPRGAIFHLIWSNGAEKALTGKINKKPITLLDLSSNISYHFKKV